MPEVLLQFKIIRDTLSFYRRWAPVLILSVGLLGLIGYASNESVGLFYVAIIAATAMVAAFHSLFGGRSAFFNVILANVITIYLCFFSYFVESLFQDISPWFIIGGFLLPLAGFLGGAVFRKSEIKDIIESQTYINEAKFIRSFLWLLPIGMVGIFAFILHQSHDETPFNLGLYFIGEMSVISTIAFFASRDLTLMLIDTGFLFGDFFEGNKRMIKPLFAFFTFYSMAVIIFGGIYKVMEHLSRVQHFAIHGEPRDLSFIEALYFSIVTLSTTGYGDIVPLTNAVRIVVGVQTFLGAMLFFFGVHAIIAHDKTKHKS